MNERNYVAFYNQKRAELTATSSYGALKKAVKLLNVPVTKAYLVSVVLTDVPVNTASL